MYKDGLKTSFISINHSCFLKAIMYISMKADLCYAGLP